MGTADPRPVRRSWQGRVVRFAPYIAGGMILIILPPLTSSYPQIVMTKILIFAIFAMSLNLILGYTGLLSLGHAAYLGVGGYAVGILMVRYGVESFWVGAPLAILMSSLIAAVFGIIALRVSGLYFLLVTFAMGQLLVSLAFKWKWLSTNPPPYGTEGVIGISRPALGLPWLAWDVTYFYFFVFIVFVVCLVILHRIVNSPFGHALQGIRDSELRMRALGYNTWLYKYVAFVVAAAFAGVAGVLLAYHNGAMVPSAFGVLYSGLAMLMVIIGGTGTLYGPVFGSAVIIIIEFYSSTFTPERWPLILGGVFVLAVMYARAGIGVYLSRLWKRVLSYGNLKG